MAAPPAAAPAARVSSLSPPASSSGPEPLWRVKLREKEAARAAAEAAAAAGASF